MARILFVLPIPFLLDQIPSVGEKLTCTNCPYCPFELTNLFNKNLVLDILDKEVGGAVETGR